MTPPVLHELIDEYLAFLIENAELLNGDPGAFFDKLQEFMVYLICRSYREGARRVMKNVNTINTN